LKPIVGILLAAGYLAALAALVRHEGAAYRRELSRRRDMVVAELHMAPTTDAKPPSSAPSPPPIETRPAVLNSPASPTAEKVGVGPTPSAPVKSAVEPRRPGIRRLSAPEARERGDELSRLIASGHPLRDDAAAIRRLEKLLGDLAVGRSGPGETITFHVLDSNEVNAFSHIGGHIFVSRGVFTLAQTDAELEFVIAHELAHLELGHAAARLESVVAPSAASGGLVLAISHLIAEGYSAEQEFEADDRAYQAMRHAGRSHRQSIGFLRRYSGYAEAHHLVGRRPPRTEPGDARQDVENHYPAHPPAGLRLKRLEAQSAAAR
jgi:putative metalloprotease